MEPRLRPLPRDAWDAETREVLGDSSLNIFATLAYHPKLLKRWLVFGNHVLAKSTLPARDRELLILRTGWNCRSPYEWGQHVAIARVIGVDDAEIVRVSEGPDASGWSEADAALLRAADELHRDDSLSDVTYAALAARTGRRIAVVFDGGPVAGLPEGVHDRVLVAYARRRGADAADDRIAEEVRRDRDPASLTVVTSDGALAGRVRALGARVEGAGSLTRELERERP